MKMVRRQTDGSDQMEDLRVQLNAAISELIAQANEAGYSTRQTLEILGKLLHQQKQALTEDPDPADDPGQG